MVHPFKDLGVLVQRVQQENLHDTSLLSKEQLSPVYFLCVIHFTFIICQNKIIILYINMIMDRSYVSS